MMAYLNEHAKVKLQAACMDERAKLLNRIKAARDVASTVRKALDGDEQAAQHLTDSGDYAEHMDLLADYVLEFTQMIKDEIT